jgi:signal transduction histidine kinase/DNA-binding NarL/FixJ family response regulator
MLKNAPAFNIRKSHLDDDVSNANVRWNVFVSIVLVFALAYATTVALNYLVARNIRQTTVEHVQAHLNSLGQQIDRRLSIYTVALETVAESHSLREEFDLSIVEREARRIGALFQGWFVISRAGDVMEFLMSTATSDGDLPPPEPRTNYPEVMWAEAESERTGKAVVSNAFEGHLVNDLVVTTVKPIETSTQLAGFIYFSVTRREIRTWINSSELEMGEFASISDGSRTFITWSPDNDFLLSDLQDGHLTLSEGQDSSVQIVQHVDGGATWILAIKRLQIAPSWTVSFYHRLPTWSPFTYNSLWPAVSGFLVLLLGSAISWLLVSRREAQSQSAARQYLLTKVRAADRHKSRLMAVLAHDLRTPLIGMLGSLDLFRSHAKTLPQERILSCLKADGHGMLTLIDDVLELARLGAGEALLRPEPFAPITLLRQVGGLVRLSAERHGTEVVVQVDDLPMLVGDVASLRRVLLNFMTNAVKATRGGSVQLSATLRSAGPGDPTLTFAVTDTGRGIAPEDISKLFCDFGQLERDTPRGDGTGLGLAICRRLAAAMGGEVGVESALGEGSSFWLRLTLPLADEAVLEPDNETVDPLVVLAGLKVLIAEDYDIIRHLTCATLIDAGMLPTEAADGEIAVELSEVQEFDLILMDLKMPRLDGDEAAARIRGGGGPSARAHIICVTAHQSPEVALMMSDRAFDACIRKPFEINQLAEMMQGVLASSITTVSLEDFDTDKLTQLHKIEGGALLKRSLKSFAADIEAARTVLAALITKRDISGAGRLVHKLVGCGDILGARTLTAELRKFEDLIRDDDIEAVEGALEWIDDAMYKTQAQVDHQIEEIHRQHGL